MNLYEINSEIENLVDEETGEVLDFAKFEELNLARESKLENIALWVKNLNAEAEAIKAEKKALNERQKSAENKSKKLKEYLSEMLAGEKFKTPKVSCSFRKSKSVEIFPGFIEWAKGNDCSLLTFKEPEPDKTAIKERILLCNRKGNDFEYAEIKKNINLSIK